MTGPGVNIRCKKGQSGLPWIHVMISEERNASCLRGQKEVSFDCVQPSSPLFGKSVSIEWSHDSDGPGARRRQKRDRDRTTSIEPLDPPASAALDLSLDFSVTWVINFHFCLSSSREESWLRQLCVSCEGVWAYQCIAGKPSKTSNLKYIKNRDLYCRQKNHGEIKQPFRGQGQ